MMEILWDKRRGKQNKTKNLNKLHFITVLYVPIRKMLVSLEKQCPPLEHLVHNMNLASLHARTD